MIATECGRLDIMLGDNRERPWCWYRVPQFEMAAERGMRVLAGTDPLPLKGEERRVGSYGFRVSVDRAEGQSMTNEIRSMLENPDIPIQTSGKHITISGFISKELRLCMRRLTK